MPKLRGSSFWALQDVLTGLEPSYVWEARSKLGAPRGRPQSAMLILDQDDSGGNDTLAIRPATSSWWSGSAARGLLPPYDTIARLGGRVRNHLDRMSARDATIVPAASATPSPTRGSSPVERRSQAPWASRWSDRALHREPAPGRPAMYDTSQAQRHLFVFAR